MEYKHYTAAFRRGGIRLQSRQGHNAVAWGYF